MTHLIEGIFQTKYDLPKKPLHTYYTLERTANLISKSVDETLFILQHSNILHGAVHNDDFYIHPESVLNYIKKRMKSVIKKELKSAILH